MVHNGIEYGDMQLIAEAYDLLKHVAALGTRQMVETFEDWSRGDDLKSFLVEITARVLEYVDPDTEQPLVEVILDKAGAKGTGKWTVQTALDLGVAIPTITAAVDAAISPPARPSESTPAACSRVPGRRRSRRTSRRSWATSAAPSMPPRSAPTRRASP